MGNLAKQIGDMDLENSGEIIRIKALISSMTNKERQTPSIINLSRKRRLANGAGLSEVQVNKILKQFKNAAKMAKKLSGKDGKGMQQMLSQMGGANSGMPTGFGQ
jgi:signal recognition particle subunit SRP54